VVSNLLFSDVCELLINIIQECSRETTPQVQLNDILSDACVSALGKVVLTSYNGPNKQELVSYWLESLPLKIDIMEGLNCYGLLCACVQQ
jgi:hypothetical protein